MSKSEENYSKALEKLQAQLVRTQQALIASGGKVLVVLEGRDAAGKDGVIKRITEHLSPRNTRVAALPKPSDREKSEWYFQRYAAHLPACGEIVLFNRSWYNRGGVEPVMGFCTPEQHEQFLRDAPEFERMLIEADIRLVKFWLDISKDEQAERLEARRKDPLKLLKVSPLDAEAQKRWDAYTAARDEMLTRTHTALAPWTCVRNDRKKAGRLALIRSLLRKIAPQAVADEVAPPDPEVLFAFEVAALKDGRLAR
jgi:polyphosphate kinase 2